MLVYQSPDNQAAEVNACSLSPSSDVHYISSYTVNSILPAKLSPEVQSGSWAELASTKVGWPKYVTES